MRLPVTLLFSLLVLAALFAAVVAVDYATIPTHSTPATHFDTIIVLGTPANLDGSPSPEQRERTLEGVREYRAGIAPKLIMTGGAAHNRFTEAHIMALLAAAQGVPPADILEEPQALNTIQNIFYSAGIMQQHGWSSAEVISSPSHLPRTALILSTFDHVQPALALAWRTHAAPWPPEYSVGRKFAFYTAEATYCLRLRLLGFPRSRFLPDPAKITP